MALPSVGRIPLNCAAGAVSVRNEKGEITMEKVKVTRYVAGKRPEYAKYSSDEEDEDMEVFGGQVVGVQHDDDDDLEQAFEEAEKTDRRLRRLQERSKDEVDEEMEQEGNRRRLHQPEVISMADDEMSGDEDEGPTRHRATMEEESSDEEEEMDDEEIERRRQLLRQKVQKKDVVEKDLLDVEEEVKSEEEEEEDSSEYEEYSDSEEETGPRLKPVFVRRSDRVTVQERKKMELDEEKQEENKKKTMEERKKYSRKVVEELVRKELQEAQGVDKEEDVVITDNENDEEEYEAWKVRELKRIKRDREERDQITKERQEIERIHGLSEEQRRIEFKNNPKEVTNKANKGKYKFLQKYYHRGAFFLDEEDTVYKRNFASPTLEDHFDKTVVPKVMQVKNFGRSGRTKYTHLVDQDTTNFESAWTQENPLATKFYSMAAGGSKQSFEKPSKKRK